MSKKERITAEAKNLLNARPEGIRFAHLITALKNAFPDEPDGNLRGAVWNLDSRFPDEVYKPSRGLMRLTKFRSGEELQADIAAKEQSAITIHDFLDTVNDIRSRYRHLSQSDLFTLWFLVSYLIDDEGTAANSLVGGAGDKGVDAIWVDDAAKAVFVIQSKFRESLGDKQENRNDVLGILEVARHLSQSDEQGFSRYLQKMDSLVADRLPVARKRHLDDGYRVLLYFVTLGKVSNTIVNDAKNELNNLSRLVSMEVVESTRAAVIMRNYLDGVAPTIPACSLEIESGNHVRVKTITQRYDEKNGIECWVLSMRGDKIADLFRSAGTRLFARNVRGYLGQRPPVNEAMRETLQDSPDRFFYYNNGITILCDEAEERGREGREVLHIKHPQIINGQQTTRTLAKYPEYAANASVLVKVFAVTQQSVEDVNFNTLLSSIVTGTNYQSPIRQSDLKSNDRVQVALERSMRKLGYGYIRKRQAGSEEKVHVGGKQFHRIKMEEFAQSVAACELDGYVARSSKEKLFDEEKYKVLFPTQEPFFYLARYWLTCKVKEIIRPSDERKEVRWLLISFIWSKIAPLLRSNGQLRTWTEQCQREERALCDPLSKCITLSASAAIKFYEATNGRGDEDVDMATFFKSRRSSLNLFISHLKRTAKPMNEIDKLVDRISRAIAQE